MSHSVLSQTLKSISLTKIRELEKVIRLHEQQKQEILKQASDPSLNQQSRIQCLLEGLKKVDSEYQFDQDIQNISRFVEQSNHDQTIPASLLAEYEADLRSKLDIKSRKLDLADLYSKLLTEWMNEADSNMNPLSDYQDSESESSFEVVERQKERLRELCDKFEKVVFEALNVDAERLNTFLEDVFVGKDKQTQKQFNDLKETISKQGERILNTTNPFKADTVRWCIEGLLAESLMSDEKSNSLRELLDNDMVLTEIADVLNMRYSDIQNWEWFAGPEGIRVMPRPELNGKYRIWMDEDVLQAILIHYVGMKLCVVLHGGLERFFRYELLFKGCNRREENDKEIEQPFQFYTGKSVEADSVRDQVKNEYMGPFFLCQLPRTEQQHCPAYEEEDKEGDEAKRPERFGNIKQRLLRKAATEIFLRGKLHGDVAAVQTDLQWFGSAISHQMVLKLMDFMGIPQGWVIWFQKFLEAPLNMDHACEGREQKGPRKRLRGMPMAHAPEKFIGEMVLFAMDLAVYRKTGILVHRLHDDIWFWGEPAKVAEAWETIKNCAEVLGLEFNNSKTGSIYLSDTKSKDNNVAAALPRGPFSIAFLILNPETGKWEINQDQVDAHVKQLGQQLSECSSVLSWIQTWNVCIGRFFGNVFGEPAVCLGREHIESILSTYVKMQQTLFPAQDGTENGLTHAIKDMLKTRFDQTEIPDPFLYLPEELGGLGVRNPFIRLFLVSGSVPNTPDDLWAEFLEKEKTWFAELKDTFDNFLDWEREKRLQSAFHKDAKFEDYPFLDKMKFMSFSDFQKHRDLTNPEYMKMYWNFQSVAKTEGIAVAKDLLDWGYCASNYSEEVQWILQLHKNELMKDFGGISMIPENFLPVAVLEMMRKKKVVWRMVL